MSNRQAFIDTFLNRDAPVQVYPAKVKSVSGNTCTVILLSSELEIEGVRLLADVDAESPVLVTPKKESMVLIGCIENELANSFVCQYSEIESGGITIGKTVVSFDKDSIKVQNDSCSVTVEQSKVTLLQGETTIELSGGKMKLSNGSVSLKGLLDDLSTLIQNFKVVTPSGLSTALGPDSIVALTQFKTKYPQLLS